MVLAATDIRLPKLPLLGEEETKDLIRRSRAGDSSARDKLVQHNLRLVMSIVARFGGRGADDEDLFQIGCLGLLKAIAKFDPDHGVQFSTYAVPLIMGEIRQYLRDAGPVKINRSIKETARRISAAREKFLQQLGREPTVTELQEETRLSREEIAVALEAMQPVRYFQEYVGEDGQESSTLENHLPAGEDQQESWFDRVALHEVLNQLEPRLKRILQMRFFDEMTQTQVAGKMGISQVHVSRLEREALHRLKSILEEQFP